MDAKDYMLILGIGISLLGLLEVVFGLNCDGIILQYAIVGGIYTTLIGIIFMVIGTN